MSQPEKPKLVQTTFDWDAAAAPAVENQDSLALEQSTIARPTDHTAELPAGIVQPGFFKQLLHTSNIYSDVQVHFPPHYQDTVMAALASFRRRSTAIANHSQYTYQNEARELETLVRLGETLGPVALLQRVATQYNKTSKNEYATRMYSRSGSPDSVIWRTESIFETQGNTLNLAARKRQQQSGGQSLHSRLAEDIADGTIQAPTHPKESVLNALISSSPHLSSGGRVLVICDHPQTAKYLTMKVMQWEGVSGATNIVNRGTKETLNDRNGAFSSADGSVEVIVLKPSQLSRALLESSSIAAALTVIYNAGVNVKTGQPTFPAREAQVHLHTPQVIELSVPGQKIKNKTALLNLSKVIDKEGTLLPPPGSSERERWWDR